MKFINGLFARAEALEVDILDLLEREPHQGQKLLDQLVNEIRAELGEVEGAAVYRLTGPEPAKATPMQYGGFFLERERELLSFAVISFDPSDPSRKLWLFVDCGPGAYLDFVSDLPADVLAWDAKKTGFPLSEMRKVRTGPLCTNEDGSDLSWEEFELKARPRSRSPKRTPKEALIG